MAKIAVFGELLVDFTPAGDDRYQYNPGGGPANMACMAKKRGAEASFIGQVGNDSFGRKLKAKLDSEGVDTEALKLSSEYPTTLAFVHHGKDGERSFSFYRHGSADTKIEVSELAKQKIDAAEAFYCSTVLMSEGSSADTSFELLKYAKEQEKIIAFDPNLRPNLWDDEGRMRKVVLEAMQYPDLVKMSEEELAFLTEEEGLIPGIMWLVNTYRNIQTLIITQGAEGSTVFIEGEMVHVDSYEVKAIDTTGAGDAFMGAFLAEMLLSKETPETVEMPAAMKMAAIANACGALTTTAMGGIDAQPSKDAVERLMNV